MLARDWYYNERRRIGLGTAVATIDDGHDDSNRRGRAALTMLGVQQGWRVADIGCGNGLLACEAALMGADVDAIDISPAMLALAEIQARDRKVAIRTQSAGLLSFAYQPDCYDLIVSEFALHHLPDFWKAVALAGILGFGFVASRLALDELSPALMTAMRFSIAALPCLLLRRPNVSWRVLIAISGSLFLGQFLAQSWAIAQGVPVGLASVVVQSQ